MRKVVYIYGGWGNNLFQLNKAYNLKERGFDVEINLFMTLEKSFLVHKLLGWTHHKSYHFFKKLEILEQSELSVIKRFDFSFILILFLKKIRLRVNNFYIGHYFDEPLNSNLLYVLKESIKRFRNEVPTEYLGKCFVHFRGGDFLKLGIGLPLNYFASINQDEIFLVTDDPDNASFLFSDLKIKIKIIKSNSAIYDFLLLANSGVLYLSNSTFSWWASELSEASIIYQPKVFYKHINFRPLTKKNRIEI